VYKQAWSIKNYRYVGDVSRFSASARSAHFVHRRESGELVRRLARRRRRERSRAGEGGNMRWRRSGFRGGHPCSRRQTPGARASRNGLRLLPPASEARTYKRRHSGRVVPHDSPLCALAPADPCMVASARQRVFNPPLHPGGWRHLEPLDPPSTLPCILTASAAPSYPIPRFMYKICLSRAMKNPDQWLWAADGAHQTTSRTAR
jgi:hypothetical protein